MTTFKEIQGRNIRAVSTDPANPGEGEMWYNKTIGVLKGVVASGAWSSGANMISAKTSGGSLPSSPSTYGLAGGGSTNDSWTGVVNNTFSWNGSGWSSESNMNVARNGVRGDGTSTSALFVGGIRPPAANYSNETESWNGSTWTTETTFPQAINETSVAGTETAAVAAGGYDFVAAPSTGGRTRETFEYNGSTWTAQNNKPFGASNMGSAGTQTASIFFGGFGQPGDGGPPGAPVSTPLSSAEEYDGTNWTTVGSLNTARYGLTGSGVQSDAGAIGGFPAINNFERWDGSSWTNSATLGTGRQTGFAGGSPASTDGAFIGGGSTPSVVSSTEVFNFSATVTTPATWASGGTMGTARYSLAGTGSQTAGLVFGGTPPARTLTESYDGTTWTEVNDLGTARYGNAGCGTQTAALAFGGGPGTLTETEEFNGTSWSEQNDLSTGRRSIGGTGTQTAGLAFGGFTTVETGATEEYDGTNWSTGGSLNTARRTNSGSGTQTAGLAIAGTTPATTGATEEYDGSVWTVGGSLITARQVGAASNGLGTQNGALYFGGNPGSLTSTEGYDGVSWSTRPSLSTGRAYIAGFGSGSSAVAAANLPTSGVTEEFTGETVSANIKTFTTS